ncbi:hypothetical protein HRF68_21630 [Pseudomonas stutzeri]|nr:hypothetical protein [Stutzerimonas stutzeri]
MLAQINQAIAALDKSGELTRIYDKWMGQESIYKMKRDFKVESVSAAAQADASK